VSVGTVIKHGIRTSPILLSPVACLAAPCFTSYLINSTLLEKKKNFIDQKNYAKSITYQSIQK